MAKKLKEQPLIEGDPEMELAERLTYLEKPLEFVIDRNGSECVLLTKQEFRRLLYHLRTLLTVVNSLDDESVSMEEFVAELQASGRFPSRR